MSDCDGYCLVCIKLAKIGTSKTLIENIFPQNAAGFERNLSFWELTLIYLMLFIVQHSENLKTFDRFELKKSKHEEDKKSIPNLVSNFLL